MKKFKLLPIFLVASTLALSSCNLFGSKTSSKKKKKSSSSDTTYVTSDTSGSGSSSSSGGPTEATLQSIALSNIQSSYNVGDSFVKPTVVATYSDSSTKTVTEQTTFTGYNLSTPGAQTVTASYTDGVTKTAQYTITVFATDWSDDQKGTMTGALDGIVLPWVKGTWEVELYSGQVYCSANDVAVADATTVFDADNGWTYEGVDSVGDPLYTKPTQSEGTVTANIYKNNNYTCIINAWFTEKQERTTDTDWNQETKEIMHHVLGNQEELPFMAFGSKYGIGDYNDFGFEFYDEYAEDLTAEYLEVLATSDWTYLRDDEYGDPVYGKSFGDGTSAEINIYFYEGYGNCIDATFIPVKTESATWPSFDELTAIQTESGYTVPEFTSTAYTWYTRYGVAYIEGTATENLVAAYGVHVDELGIINSVSTNYGSATNWEETFFLTYSALTDDDDQDVFTGFLVSAAITEPESNFMDAWDDELVDDYFNVFDVENPGVPVFESTSGKQLKWDALFFEEVYAEYLEYYAKYIEAGYITEELVAEWAHEDSGLFIEGYDPTGADLTAYNAVFASDTSWEHEQKTEDNVVYDYYTKNGVTVCVFAGLESVTIKIMEPSEPEPPVPPTPVEESTTYTFTNKKNSTAATDLSVIYGWFNASGDNIITGVSSPTYVYPGANGGSGDTAWSLDNALKIGKSGDGGSLTFTLASGVSVTKIVISGYGWKNSSSKALVISIGGQDSASDPLTYANKANVEGGLANSVEFEFDTALTGSFTISTGSTTAVLITSIQIFYE